LPAIRTGPYRLLAHPNYVAVAIELVCIPMIFGGWVTAVVASVLNAALLLGVRIPAEQQALREASMRA
jgi:methyltransferase